MPFKTTAEVFPDLNAPKKSVMPDTCEGNLLPNGQLRVQCGMRIRLSDDDRKVLKEAYRNAVSAEAPQNVNSNKSTQISVATSWNTPSLTRQLGMDSCLFSQLVNSRDPLSLPLLLRFQKVLGVKLVNKTYLKKVFESYVAWIDKDNV